MRINIKDRLLLRSPPRKRLAIGFILLSILFLWFSYSGKNPDVQISPYPYGKNFAFTITDDPDGQRLEKIKPIYDFLSSEGLRTTLAVWVKNASRSNGYPEKVGQFDYGETSQNKAYLSFVKNLQKKGFEVAMHTASGGNDRREETIEGYEEFKRLFDHYPKMNIMHSGNLENVYWGNKVVTNRFVRWLIGLSYGRAKLPFQGEIPNSPYFWGDILKEKTKYVRLWGTGDINTLKFNLSMPFHDPSKPYVNYWYSFSDGWTVKRFNNLISDKKIEKLQKERGVCIVYTHFARGFVNKDTNGGYQLDPVFKTQMQKLSRLTDGWFAPASILLDRLLLMKNIAVFENDNAYIIINANQSPIDGLTLLVNKDTLTYYLNGQSLQMNKEGEVILESIGAGQAITLYKNQNQKYLKDTNPNWFETIRLFFNRTIIFLKHKFGNN